MKNKVSATLLNLIQKTVAACGIELYDVEFKGKTLRVLIHKPSTENKLARDGVSVETCAFVSEKLSQRLDAEDLISGQYFLEVSSPGIERKLRNPKDFQQVIGQHVAISTKQGTFKGKLLSVLENGINIKNIVGSCGKLDQEQFIFFNEIKYAHIIISNQELFKDKILTD
ncbi:MAG: ribosome maturation factor RimP [candidate division WOR-3 bacterium]